MIVLLTILCALAVIVAIIACNEDWYFTSLWSCCGAVLIGIVDVICIIIMTCYMFDGITSKSKISMYQEENTKIETQIGDLVKNYMDYESDTYKEFKNESSITLVNLYPELKSDELVQKQMNIYLSNNDKIKELKEKEIDTKIGKWLLYFGN